MSASRVSNQSGEGLLWVLSLVASLVLNGLIFFSFVAVSAWKMVVSRPPVSQEPVETVAMIVPMVSEPSANTAAAPAAPAVMPDRPAQFARTSEDQRAAKPENPSFLGERDTRATSDRAPDPTAPALPSQAGVDLKREEFETTQSDFRDGALGAPPKISPLLEPPPEPTPAPLAEAPIPALLTPEPLPPEEVAAKTEDKTPGQEPESPKETKLLQGPNPVDVPVHREAPKDAPKPTPEARAQEEEQPKPTPEPLIKKAEDAPKPKPKPKPTGPDPTLPGASGHQRKNQIRGSIARTGRSALDVVDSPLGRYQAQISRAVELEWQRNCVRYRDLITPGFLTVRFVVAPDGKVRSVGFVESVKVGEVQRGFTLNSIRDADIPKMPPALKKELGDEPLELIFNFYF